MPSAAELVLVGTTTRAPRSPCASGWRRTTTAAELCDHLTASAAVAEAVGLSTCNRCELYMVGADADAMREAAVAGLGHLSGHAAEQLEPMLYVHRGELAARHLFGVAGGLDSMVPGEAQILAQIREAYESAYEWDATGPVTNRLFHQALEAGKRVRHETAIGEGGASPASVAADLAVERMGGRTGESTGARRGRRPSGRARRCQPLRPRRLVDHRRQPRPRPGRCAGVAVRRPRRRLRRPAGGDRSCRRRRRLDGLAGAPDHGRRRAARPPRS